MGQLEPPLPVPSVSSDVVAVERLVGRAGGTRSPVVAGLVLGLKDELVSCGVVNVFVDTITVE